MSSLTISTFMFTQDKFNFTPAIKVVDAWNDLCQSLAKETKILTFVQNSLKAKPPWKVVDSAERFKRIEAYEEAIEENRRQIKALEQLLNAESAENK